MRLWDACTVKVILGGLADVRDLEMISRMCGEVDSESAGRTYGPEGSVTRTVSRRRVPALTPGEVRTLRRWHGLVFYEELRPIEAALPGWWELSQYRCRVERSVARLPEPPRASYPGGGT